MMGVGGKLLENNGQVELVAEGLDDNGLWEEFNTMWDGTVDAQAVYTSKLWWCCLLFLTIFRLCVTRCCE